MTVQLVYLARLRESLGTTAESVDLPRDVTDVASLLAWLRRRGGPWADELAPGRAVRVAVNHDIARDETAVRAGDEIALFPPVTGG